MKSALKEHTKKVKCMITNSHTISSDPLEQVLKASDCVLFMHFHHQNLDVRHAFHHQTIEVILGLKILIGANNNT